jgi:Fe-S cluster assembly protein SufB
MISISMSNRRKESGRTWDDVPETIKNTFDKLGIPEAEQKYLSGVGAQYDSEMIYHSIQESLEKQGVIFFPLKMVCATSGSI